MYESQPDYDPLFPETEIKFAGFGSRFGATMIDSFIILIISMPLTYYNVISWKSPYLFILISVVDIIYKPVLEYRYGATFGKMALGLKVVGRNFEKVTLKEELRRVSFYIIPTILFQIMTLRFYFSPELHTISNFNNYNQFVIYSNPGILWVNGIVLILGAADFFTFFSNTQRQSLHDIYACTYVIDLR